MNNLSWLRVELFDTRDNNIIWTIPGPLNYNLMVGLMVAGISVLDEYYKYDNYGPRDYRYQLRAITTQETFTFNNMPFDHEENLLSKYNATTLLQNVSPGKLGIVVLDHYIETRRAGFTTWRYFETDRMDLFLQGFISIFQAFNVDFKENLLDLPTDSDGIKYDVPEYNLRVILDTTDEEYEFD